MEDEPSVVAAALPESVRLEAARLAYEPTLYFTLDATAIEVPIDRLRLSRARPDGIASAVGRMAEAAAGVRTRRVPVNVHSLGADLYQVLDGNSTVVVAAAAGWPSVPCIVEQ